MAKGQKRGNRELKKKKAAVKKPAAGNAVSAFQQPQRTLPTKGASK